MVNRSHCPGLKPCVISLTPVFLLHPKSKPSTFYFVHLECLSPSSICMTWISSSSNLYSNDTLVRPLPYSCKPTTPYSLSLFPTLPLIMWHIFSLSAPTSSKLQERIDICFSLLYPQCLAHRRQSNVSWLFPQIIHTLYMQMTYAGLQRKYT